MPSAAPEKPSRPHVTAGRKTRAAKKKSPGKKKGADNKPRLSRRLLLSSFVLEIAALIAIGLMATVAALGYAAMRFSGLSLATNLLPFAAVILAVIVACALSLALWFFVRRWLVRLHPFCAAGLALALAVACGFVASQPDFFPIYEQFRTMVGGREEVARRQLAHQVYAAYRRIAPRDAEDMLAREKLYDQEIAAAARVYQIDQDLLSGLAAVESSFLPRSSADGGDGLFQITSVPKAIAEAIDRQLTALPPSPPDAGQRRNALLGAATLAHYIGIMNGDVFLGLLAYNIGPKNGGLHSIMEQYGARDFVAIQPYLQYFPRDYPVKVFAWALLFRIARITGGPLLYQDGTNAARIQAIGIPGLGQR
ncbi:MAG: lytic transglycosylase domain-containing protein [Desulfobulbaceae bacterium]|nr:lytic transglycosylase domain-containing protein [Desulfobulbaceae bacterium]